MLPWRSITSIWQVSPTNSSRSAHSVTGGSAAKVGSPTPKRTSAVASVRVATSRSGMRGAWPFSVPAVMVSAACSPMPAARAAR
ncbi:hypothetical protein D3C86_1556370 [compost metagenome]